MPKITKDMVAVLNLELKEKGCCFGYTYDEEGFSGNPHIEIAPASTDFLSSYILNLSEEGFNFVRNFFKERDIELGTNNDRSIMWSLTGWGSDILATYKATES